MAFGRGPKIVKDGLILLADPSNPKSNAGIAGMKDIVGSWSQTRQTTSELSLTGNPSVITNSSLGGSIYYSRSPYIDWATTSFTFSGWGKRDDYSDSKEGRIYDCLNAGNGHLRLTLDGTPDLNFRPTAGGSTDLVSGGTTTAGNWYNVVVTKEGTTSGGSADYTLYVNGEQVATNTSSALVTDANFTIIRIMRSVDDDTPSISWNGDFGQFMVYNRAISADEVLQNYNATKSRFGL